jgi:hypothetical protein
MDSILLPLLSCAVGPTLMAAIMGLMSALEAYGRTILDQLQPTAPYPTLRRRRVPWHVLLCMLEGRGLNFWIRYLHRGSRQMLPQ